VAIRSEELFRNAQEVIIIHREQEYRLRVTRAEKLILTK
jgi:hemin uptake protein HemP